MVPALLRLPRLRIPHGLGHPRRGRLARSNRLYARGHGLLHQPAAERVHRSEGRRHRLLPQSHVRAGFGAAESPTEVPGYQETVHHFSDEALKIIYVEYETPGPNRMPW